MDPSSITGYKHLKSKTPDESHALILAKADGEGRVSWWAAYAWERAGEIRSALEWRRYLEGFPDGR